MASESGSSVGAVAAGKSARGEAAADAATSDGGDEQARPTGGRESSSGAGVDSLAPLQCFIAGCPSSTATPGGRAFFKLPVEKDRCQQWLKICRREDLIGESTSCIDSCVICSNHFIQDQFRDASRKVLKNLAVPTIFDTVCASELEQEEGSVANVLYELVEMDEECEDVDDAVGCGQLCRLCGCRSEDIVYIFGSAGSDLNIASKINSLLPITVDNSDHLPKQICSSCLAKLDTTKNLFETCLRADEHLKNLARKRLFRSHFYKKDTHTHTYSFQHKTEKNKVNVDESSGFHATNDRLEEVTSGDGKPGSCDVFSERGSSNCYVCPFNCGGVMITKYVTSDCCNENEDADVKNEAVNVNSQATCEIVVTEEESKCLVQQSSAAETVMSPNVMYQLRDEYGQEYTTTAPLPGLWHRGAGFDNLEIVIHTLDPNFKVDDEVVHAEVQETKELDAKADQISCGAFPNLELLAEHSKTHSDNACLCTLCMVRFESPAELACHMKGHRGSSKKMTRIVGSKRFGCSVCLRKFNNEKTWRRHLCAPGESAPIRCPVCMKAFQTEERLAFHKKFHDGAKPNYCEKCSKNFDNESLLYYHCSLVHEGDRPYACNLCNKRFFSNTRLMAHKRVHTGERPYECNECTSRFYDHETLKRHFVTHMSVKPFQCELCGILCGRKSLLRQHIQVHHLTPEHLRRGHSLIHYHCKLCDKTFTGSRDVLTHRDTHWHVDNEAACETGSTPLLVCEFCAKRVSDLSVLARHRKESHCDEKPYICSVCKLSSHTLHEARLHRRTHTTVSGDAKTSTVDVTTKENTFICEECGMQLSGGWNLRAHMKYHKQESLHKCLKCNRIFPNKHKLAVHLRHHTGEKPFSCQQCSKQFSQSSALHIHMLLHTGEKPHSCDLCEATFRIKADRDNHRRTHTGEKPFRCEYCSKEFRTGQVYYQHRMIHTGERRFPCDICGKAFKRSHTLVVHKRIHTGEKPNICDICGKGFRQRTDMRKHRAIHTNR